MKTLIVTFLQESGQSYDVPLELINHRKICDIDGYCKIQAICGQCADNMSDRLIDDIWRYATEVCTQDRDQTFYKADSLFAWNQGTFPLIR